MSKYEGVHSCGPNCTQPLCVANRRIEELEATIDTVTKSRDYWKNHWINAYSELRGIDPAALKQEGE